MAYADAVIPIDQRTCSRCGLSFSAFDGKRKCIACRKIPKSPSASLDPKRDLTPRQRQIAELVAQGKTNKEIAYLLNLSYGTIKQYINIMFQKTGMKNRTELALKYSKEVQNVQPTS